jgi:hypothetical protein
MAYNVYLLEESCQAHLASKCSRLAAYLVISTKPIFAL